jgi:hypothetical protein
MSMGASWIGWEAFQAKKHGTFAKFKGEGLWLG